jgi:hypothetical protein
MERNGKTLARVSKNGRKWAIGALVALTMVGAFASAGAGGAKPGSPPGLGEPPASPAAQGGPVNDGVVLLNRLWVDDMTRPGEWIEVESWSWGVSQSGAAGGGGGGGAGKASFQDLHVSTHLSVHSPEFVELVATGKHVKKIMFETYKPASKGSNETTYLRITLEDCLISSFQTAAPP